MSNNSRRRIILFVLAFVICTVVLLMSNVFTASMEPDAYNYYIENAVSESEMTNAVTAIYLRYRLFDTLFEALLLGVAVSVVFYFAAPWEKDMKEKGDWDDA